MGDLIVPPFDFNSSHVSKHSPEVTGRILIKSMCERLGWPSLAGKRIIDFGCGVRLARTIINLEMEVGLYVGIDVNAPAIAWLAENVNHPCFRFIRLNMRNEMYNADGQPYDGNALSELGLDDFDLACLHSVITHQKPDDAERIFLMLRRCAHRLYFTAFIDENVDGFEDRDPQKACNFATYSTERMTKILSNTGWHTEAIHPLSKQTFQATAFVCRR